MPMGYLWALRINRGLPLGYAWATCDMPMGYQPIGYPWNTHGMPMIYHWKMMGCTWRLMGYTRPYNGLYIG